MIRRSKIFFTLILIGVLLLSTSQRKAQELWCWKTLSCNGFESLTSPSQTFCLNKPFSYLF